MKSDPSLKWLATTIAELSSSTGVYQTSGKLPAVDPELTIDGIGRITFPLKPAIVKKLKATSQIAPFGKGTQTIINEEVRKTLELDPSRFQLGEAWQQLIAQTTRTIGTEFNLDDQRLEAHLYKLLIYERGGFFLPHRDSEKLDRMVATLIVVLPNQFTGGELKIHHAGQTRRFDFLTAKSASAPEYVAFYADCQHEVSPVRSGLRVCLAYNLVLQPSTTSAPKPTASTPVVGAIRNWFETRPTTPMIFALEHHYTAKGLMPDLLKADDRSLAQTVLAAAKEADCLAFYAQIEKHDSYMAFGPESRYASRSRRSTAREQYDIQEHIEGELDGSEWTDPAGNKQTWDSLPLEASAIVSRTPVENWVPTKEDYEGYTGNAGNTLDRWYHRSAIVLWPQDVHFEILASSGVQNAIPLLQSMLVKLRKDKTPQADQTRQDCIRLSRGIIKEWSYRWASHRGSVVTDSDRILNAFATCLTTLNDLDLVVRFLEMANLRDELTPLSTLVLAVGQKHGWELLTPKLRAFFAYRRAKSAERHTIAVRDLDWLLAICVDPSKDAAKAKIVNDLCEAAVSFFLTLNCGAEAKPFWGRNEATSCLPKLLQVLLKAKHPKLLAKLVTTVRQTPKQFLLEDCQVPTIQTTVLWCIQELAEVPEPIAEWLAAIRAELSVAIEAPPQPPRDLARAASLTDTSAHCRAINLFLADATLATLTIKAAEYDRARITHEIERDRADLAVCLIKTSRPFAMLLTKTQASYERAVRDAKRKAALLETLPEDPRS